MDWKDPGSFHHRTERLATGRSYHFVDQIPRDYDSTSCATLLCVHGFPDLWYGWRHQIGPWTAKGYRVVVPDMLGYGSTDKPSDAVEYSTKRLCDDLAALLDTIGVNKAVLIGHDWGSYIVARFALWYPERLLALVTLSLPFTPPAHKYVSTEEVAERFPELSYQAYFADPNSTREIDANLSTFLSVTFNRLWTYSNDARNVILGKAQVPPGLECIMNDQELQYYHLQFMQGMQGPLSYYRTTRYRFEEERVAKLPATLRPDLPVLLLWGSEDLTVTQAHLRRSRKCIPQLQDICLEGKGHWILVDSKEFVTEKVLHWLGDSLLCKVRL